MFTSVTEDRFRQIAKTLVDEDAVPVWFQHLEYVHWEGSIKNLTFISDCESSEALLVDDHADYVHPTQLEQFIRVEPFEPPFSDSDNGLAKVLDELAQRGISPIDPGRLPSRHHIPQDHQSLLMHREAVRLILVDPSLVLKAQATLARWMVIGSQRSVPLWEQWRDVLEQRNWDLAVEDSERGRELRQASPLSTLLPQETRLEIIARVRRMQRLDEC